VSERGARTDAGERFSLPYRVRFDECAPDGLVRTSALLRYAQDLSGAHSAARGFDRDWYARRGLAWLVRTAEIGVSAPIGVGDALSGTTRVVGFRRVWARRLTEFHGVDGEPGAWVRIDWVLVDERGIPARIPPEFDALFGGLPGGVPLGRVDPGPAPSDGYRLDFVVRPQELDPMDHVNNAVYADWLDEAVEGGDADTTRGRAGADGAAPVTARSVPRIVRLEYAASASPAARLTAVAWRANGGWSYRLATNDTTPVELLRARLEPLGPGG
jgi:acyl-CoA thioesterase FadM